MNVCLGLIHEQFLKGFRGGSFSRVRASKFDSSQSDSSEESGYAGSASGADSDPYAGFIEFKLRFQKSTGGDQLDDDDKAKEAGAGGTLPSGSC